MSQEWFYSRDGKNKEGPFSSAHLQSLAASGQLLPTDMVLKSGDKKWLPADKIKGLFRRPATLPVPQTRVPGPHRDKETGIRPGDSNSRSQLAHPLTRLELVSDPGNEMGVPVPRARTRTRVKGRHYLLIATTLLVTSGVLGFLFFFSQPTPEPEEEAIPHVVQELIKLVADPDPATRLKAVQELGDMGRKAQPAIPKLSSICKQSEMPPRVGPQTYKDTLKGSGLKYSKLQKEYIEELAVGGTYVIDLKSKEFDAFLSLLDPTGALLRQDDDSGGYLNAQIVFQPAKTGRYKIIASSLGGRSSGDYTLTITLMGGQVPVAKDAPSFYQAACKALGQIAVDCLSSRKAKDRLQGVAALRDLGPDAKDAILRLVPLLDDSSPEVRRETNNALAAIGPPKSVDYEAIVDLLKDDAPKHVRMYLVRAIGNMVEPPEKAIDALLHALKTDPDQKIRERAAIALPNLGVQMVGEVAPYRDRILPALINAVADPDPMPDYARRGLDGLKVNANKDLKALQEAAGKDKKEAIRLFAIQTLARGEVTYEIASLLITALSDKNVKARKSAVEGLGRAVKPQEKVFSALLADELLTDEATRAETVKALNDLGAPPEKMKERLCEILKNGATHLDFRKYALEKMGGLPLDEPAVDQVIEAIKVTDLQETSLTVLGRVLSEQEGDGHKAALKWLPRLVDARYGLAVRKFAVEQLGQRLTAVVDAGGAKNKEELKSTLKRLQKDNAKEIRDHAVSALGYIGGTDSLSDAIKALEDPESKDKAFAAIKKIFVSKGEPELLRCLNDVLQKPTYAEVCIYAIQTLEENEQKLDKNDRHLFAASIGRIAENTKLAPACRESAVKAMSKINSDTSAKVLLATALEQGLWERSLDAVNSLKKRYPLEEAHVPQLGKLIAPENNIKVRAFAVEELSKFGPKGVECLKRALTDPEKQIRLDACARLEGIKGAPAVKALAQALKKEADENVFLRIVEAIAKTGPEAATEAQTLIPTLLDKLGRDCDSRESSGLKALEPDLLARTATGLRDLGDNLLRAKGVWTPDWERAKDAFRKVQKADQATKEAEQSLKKAFLNRTEAVKKLQQALEVFKKSVSSYIEALRTAQQTDEKKVDLFVAAIKTMGKAAVPHLSNWMEMEKKGALYDKEHPFNRLLAAKALGEIGADARGEIPALKACAQYEQFPKIKNAALASIKKIKQH